MPCLDYLARVREAYPEIAALGVSVIAVGAGSRAQAKRLMTAGSPFPCLVDGDQRIYAALGLGRLGRGAIFRVDTYANIVHGLLRGARPGARTGDWRRQPGIALFDADLRLVWLHRASTLGDYPPPETLLARLAAVV